MLRPTGMLRMSKFAPGEFVIRIGLGQSSLFGRPRRLNSLRESIRPWPPSYIFFSSAYRVDVGLGYFAVRKSCGNGALVAEEALQITTIAAHEEH